MYIHLLTFQSDITMSYCCLTKTYKNDENDVVGWHKEEILKKIEEIFAYVGKKQYLCRKNVAKHPFEWGVWR